jgi:peptidoglycan/xylan/chitin deacetylase (PgdA/CDA1 family)
MRLPGLRRVRLTARWVRSRFVDGALILGYHRIAEYLHDPFGICVTPQHFSEQMEILSQNAGAISLQELVHDLEERTLPKRAVAVTFDDGYADTLYQAKPLLERYQIPATVFVASGYLDRQFWWDELERLLYTPADLPAQLSLTLNACAREWVLGPDASLHTRERTLLSLCDSFRPLPEEERQEAMSQVRRWVGLVPRDMSRARCLRSDELEELAAGEFVDIGAHTVTHPILTGLSKSRQRAEIEGGRAALEQILGQLVSSFSYPNGSVSADTLCMVKETGFDLACASTNDVAWRGSDRFQLPRFWVQDWGGEAFSQWLTRWLNT